MEVTAACSMGTGAVCVCGCVTNGDIVAHLHFISGVALFRHFLANETESEISIQCFDTVGLATGRASSL